MSLSVGLRCILFFAFTSTVGATVLLHVPAKRQPSLPQHHHLWGHSWDGQELVPQPGLHAWDPGGLPATNQHSECGTQVHGASAGASFCGL